MANADDLLKAIEAALAKVFSPEPMTKIAKVLADAIRVRTQLGSGVSEFGRPKDNLKVLSKSYIKARQKIASGAKKKAGAQLKELSKGLNLNKGNKKALKKELTKSNSKLSPNTKPNKSNLTFTGQLIDSITGVGFNGGFRITPVGIRDDGYKNDTIAGFVEDEGRPFLNLTDKEVKQLSRLIEDRLAEEINRALKK